MTQAPTIREGDTILVEEAQYRVRSVNQYSLLLSKMNGSRPAPAFDTHRLVCDVDTDFAGAPPQSPYNTCRWRWNGHGELKAI